MHYSSITFYTNPTTLLTKMTLIMMTEMTPDTYTFTGDATTFLGLIGVVSTALIVVVAFRRYWSSPYRR